jgi:hypothetical protein
LSVALDTVITSGVSPYVRRSCDGGSDRARAPAAALASTVTAATRAAMASASSSGSGGL